MTVEAGEAKAGPYTGNNTAAAFAFEFKVFADTDVRVIETLISTGVETDLVLNTHYTLVRNNDQDNDPGGEVTYVVGGIATALPSTKKLTIVGDYSYAQPTDIPNGGSFFAQIIENALDRTTMLVKQLKEQVDRSVKVGISSALTPDQLIDQLNTNVSAAQASATAADASADAADISEANAAASAAAASASAASIDTSSFAPKVSPALTGTPTAPTAAVGTSTTQIATTALVKASIDAIPAAITAAADPTGANNSGSAASTGWVRASMAALAVAAGFSALLSQPGYVRFPSWFGNLTFQWGLLTGIPPSSSYTGTFPLSFPTNVFCVGFCEDTNTAVASSHSTMTAISVAQFVYYNASAGGTNVWWFAIGR